MDKPFVEASMQNRPSRRVKFALGIILIVLGIALFIVGLSPLFGFDLNGRRMGNGYGVAIWCVLIGGALLKIGYDYVRYGEQRMDLDN
ncbi:hypothetical protein LBMAG48_18360 [Phycisphaerae bacterium]|jgi:hypothetical protein|nr:hypothetical protein LBMAG48_18360 [Phycisphaerae bacterium]